MSYPRDKWLEVGLEVLVEHGPTGLTIERLCRRLEKTKGSFYHHFQSRKSFHEQLLNYWEARHTTELIKKTSQGNSDSALQYLHDLTQKLPLEAEVAFRDWANSSALAAGVVARVDEARVQFVSELYQLQGHSLQQSQSLAWLEYCMFLGAAQLGKTFPSSQRRLARNLFERWVVQND